MYPTDFSEYSLAALPYAITLTLQNNAELYCLHVVELTQEEYVLKAAGVRLERFVKENLSKIVKVTSKVLVGVPFVEIIRYAREQSIDLIVIGTHGHSALATMLLGSVAEKVIRKASCPVLSIRHPKHKFEMP